MRVIIFVVCFLMAICGASYAESIKPPALELGQVAGQPGSMVIVPLLFKKGTGSPVSAVGMDISCNSELLEITKAVLVTTASQSADLKIATHSPSKGVFRIALFGNGKVAIDDGTIAQIYIMISTKAGKGETELLLTPSGSSPDGKAIAFEASTAKVIVE